GGQRSRQPGGAAAHHHDVVVGHCAASSCRGPCARSAILKHVTVLPLMTLRASGGLPVGAATLRRAPKTAHAYPAELARAGLGAAGACAAIEASDAGASVVVLDRFEGGGATALSGGVVYAGGGTSVQREAGVEDTPGAMLAYLEREVGDTAQQETLREF